MKIPPPPVKVPHDKQGLGQVIAYLRNQMASVYQMWSRLSKIGSDIPVPDSPTATGEKDTITYDSDYLYICVETNTWVRFEKSSWS